MKNGGGPTTNKGKKIIKNSFNKIENNFKTFF